jgi:hypothetical protein
MVEVTLTLAKALNVPFLIRADESYQRGLQSVLSASKDDHPMEVEILHGRIKPAALEHESNSSFLVMPGFGSRKRVVDTLGNLPERLAAAFDGNLAILHFDK